MEQIGDGMIKRSSRNVDTSHEDIDFDCYNNINGKLLQIDIDKEVIATATLPTMGLDLAILRNGTDEIKLKKEGWYWNRTFTFTGEH